MLIDVLKRHSKQIFDCAGSVGYENLLISIPSLEGNGIGLYLLSGSQLFGIVDVPCTGLWLHKDQVFVSKAFPDHMRISKISSDGCCELVDTRFSDIHDILIHNEDLYVVSTGTNEILSISSSLDGEISKRWPFSGCGESWHLNCLGVWDDRVVVSAFGQFSYYREYKGNSKLKGIVIDVESKKVLWNQLSTPHNPKMDTNRKRFVCDSQTSKVLMQSGDEPQSELTFDGAFTRGLAFGKEHMYVGLSALRRSSTKMQTTISTGTIARIDQKTMKTVDTIAIPSSEIYDIVVIP